MRTLFLIVAILFSPQVLAIFNDCSNPNHCLIAVDAGSSGSRAYLYQYRIDQDEKVKSIKILAQNKVKPGISTVNRNDFSGYLFSLFQPRS